MTHGQKIVRKPEKILRLQAIYSNETHSGIVCRFAVSSKIYFYWHNFSDFFSTFAYCIVSC